MTDLTPQARQEAMDLVELFDGEAVDSADDMARWIARAVAVLREVDDL